MAIARPAVLDARQTSWLRESAWHLIAEVERSHPRSPSWACFVAEVGAERTITLTLHTPNEAAASAHGHYETHADTPRRRTCGELGETAQVLCDGGKRELELGSIGATQSQAIETQDALQMCKQHLDFLAHAGNSS
jgi:hypothetical protein